MIFLPLLIWTTSGRHTIGRYLSKQKAPVTQKDLERLLDRVDLEELNLQAMIFLPKTRSIKISIGKTHAAKGPYVDLNRATLFP